MSLHSVSLMVIAPLALTVGAVLFLTPKDVLRQPVLQASNTQRMEAFSASTPRPVAPIAVVEFETPSLRPATLIVASSPPAEFFSAPQAAAVPSADRRWISARGLNVRTGPSARADLISSLPFGTAVDVLETSGSWAHVNAGDVTGWLSAKFLTDTDPN